MSSSNTPDQPEENPFEVSAGSQSEDAFEGTRTDATDASRVLMPPVESSYWTGVITLGLMIFVFCGIAALAAAPTAVGPLAIPFAFLSFISSLLCFALPLSLIRLWMHRWIIARAIQDETYPGGQRFDLGYLGYSLVLSTLSFLGGGILFFGICTAVLIVSESFLNPIVEFIGIPLFFLDGLISFLATLHLLRLGVPKYR
ncbi:MAG: hypothetical protein ACKOOI_09735 [Pirellula sp.]